MVPVPFAALALRIARELDYVPNAAARALAAGRTGTIAVLSGPLNEPFYANIVHLLETHLTASGYEMTLLHTRRDVSDLMQATQTWMVDGVVVIVSERFHEKFLQLSSARQPCVVIDTTARDFVDHITIDLGSAVEEALRLMLASGRHRIAYVVNNRDEATHREVRMRTYLAVMNDETAIYTYRAIGQRGYRLPDDVILVGCDGLPYMEFFDPPLSTIALPTEEICAIAAQFLQQRMAAPSCPVQQATLPGRLVVRKSLLVPT